jgi:cyclophilin family peptidyl-prolyl cis-trans isomerase
MLLRCLFFLGCTAAAALAAGEESPAERFKKAFDKNEARNAFITEANKTRTELFNKAREASLENVRIWPELRAAAEAAYNAQPNQDANVATILRRGMLKDFQRDDYEAVLRVARLLLQHKCEFKDVAAPAGKAAAYCNDFEIAEQQLELAKQSGKLAEVDSVVLAELPRQKELWNAEAAIRAAEALADDLPRVKLETTQGTIILELFENEAPQTVGNFIHLVESQFYDGLTFHRVIGEFMAQGGDPKGDGTGGPGYKIYDECHQPNFRPHFRGSLSMATGLRDTGGSQFFLMIAYTSRLDGKHTCFGRIADGIDVLAKLHKFESTKPDGSAPDRIIKAEVIRKRDHVYEPTKTK